MQVDGSSRASFPVVSSVLAPSALLAWANDRFTAAKFTDCRFFRSGMNDTYLLRGEGQRSVLLVYRLGWRSVEEIGYELDLPPGVWSASAAHSG